jgi:hypothetical protein
VRSPRALTTHFDDVLAPPGLALEGLAVGAVARAVFQGVRADGPGRHAAVLLHQLGAGGGHGFGRVEALGGVVRRDRRWLRLGGGLAHIVAGVRAAARSRR